MSDFAGYLIKAGNGDRIFPHEYINLESYKTTPNQREEIEAYRDDYTRNLTRITADGMKTSIEFSTLDGLTLEEKIEIQAFFSSAMINTQARKVILNYWNDEENTYKTSYFYLPDVQYTISKIDRESNTMTYKSISYKLVEY